MSKLKSIFISGLPTIIIAGLIVTSVVYAWIMEPEPPESNINALLNVGTTTQTKLGGLILGHGLNDNPKGCEGGVDCVGLIVEHGKVGIGTTTPGAKLHIAGQIKITGGSPGAGKILTSDATGLASWQTLTGVLPSGSSGQTLRYDSTNWVADSNLFNDGTNVGIGTTNPGAKLNVRTTDTNTIPFQVEALIQSPTQKWNYKKPITINNIGPSQTDYQVLVTLDTASLVSTGKMKADGSDIRFTDSDDTTQLNFWIESGINTASTKIWVKVPLIPSSTTKTIYVYYGNPNAASKSSVANTFIREINGVKGSWHFDEGSGTIAYDSSGNNYNGNLVNGPTWDNNGKFNKALRFDPSVLKKNHVLISSAPVTAAPFTICAWINMDQLPASVGNEFNIVHIGSSTAIPGWRGWNFRVDDDVASGKNGKLQCNVREGNEYPLIFTGNTTILPNTWNFVCVVEKLSSNRELFLNGKSDGTNTTFKIPTVNKMTIGAFNQGADDFFDGLIDEVNIYNRALTTDEIRDLYENYGYTTSAYPGKVLVRKYASSEPTITEPITEPTTSVGVEEVEKSVVPLELQQKIVFYIQNQTGNIGIGTTDPHYQLELSRDSASKPGGGSWANSSDKRLKTNITPISNALERLSKLSPVSFSWRNPDLHGGVVRSGGFLAQDVLREFPDWVSKIDVTGADKFLVGPDGKAYSLTLPFEYDAMVVGAIKELKAEIQELKAKNETLETRNQALKELICLDHPETKICEN